MSVLQSSKRIYSNQTENGLLRTCDKVSEWIIYFMVVFSPWAFGTTQMWSISVMNGAGYALGFIWLAKWFNRRHTSRGGSNFNAHASGWFTIFLGILTLLVLSYVLIGALNARATYFPADWRFEYHSYISWLPHSYDRSKSWHWFWNYLALAFTFWAARDWLIYDLEKESAASPRWHRLLWVISINGALVAFQGLLQRAEGSHKLLWIAEPRVNKSPESFFGPYAYRSNAAQFLNLVWPVTLGFWCALQKRSRENRDRRPVRLRHLLLPCAALTAIAPVVSASRGGALVTGMCVLVACLILIVFRSRYRWWKTGVAFAGIATILFGWILGWGVLGKRMTEIDAGFEQREQMFETARNITRDYPLFGTGVGSFDALFQLYRSSSEEYWPAQLHNDWLETLMTFGWLGSALLWGVLAMIWLRPLTRGSGLRVNFAVILFLWLSLGSCLIHARYDFPFQIYSILFLFLLISAFLSSVRLDRKY